MKRQARVVAKLATPTRQAWLGGVGDPRNVFLSAKPRASDQVTITGQVGYDTETAAQMIRDRMKRLGQVIAGAVSEVPPFCDSCGGPYQDEWLQLYGGHWDTCPNRATMPNPVADKLDADLAAAATPTGTDSAQRSTPDGFEVCPDCQGQVTSWLCWICLNRGIVRTSPKPKQCDHVMVKLPGIALLTCQVCGYQDRETD